MTILRSWVSFPTRTAKSLSKKRATWPSTCAIWLSSRKIFLYGRMSMRNYKPIRDQAKMFWMKNFGTSNIQQQRAMCSVRSPKRSFPKSRELFLPSTAAALLLMMKSCCLDMIASLNYQIYRLHPLIKASYCPQSCLWRIERVKLVILSKKSKQVFIKVKNGRKKQCQNKLKYLLRKTVPPKKWMFLIILIIIWCKIVIEKVILEKCELFFHILA